MWATGAYGGIAAGLICTNCITTQTLAAHGLDFNNAADRTLLASPISPRPLQSRGVLRALSGFPCPRRSHNRCARFRSTAISRTGTGSRWRHLVRVAADEGDEAFSVTIWNSAPTSPGRNNSPPVSKTISARGGGVIINDAFNRRNQKSLSVFDQPFQFVFSGSYTTPKWSSGNKLIGNKVSPGLRATGRSVRCCGTPAVCRSHLRIDKQPRHLSVPEHPVQPCSGRAPFTQDLNCHCFDPTRRSY